LVDDLLQQIYRQSSRNNEGEGNVATDDDEAFASFEEVSKDDSTNCAAGGSHFSSKCSEPLKKKGGNSKLVLSPLVTVYSWHTQHVLPLDV
jgi:hypothetical protein